MSFDLNDLFNRIHLADLLDPNHMLNEDIISFLQFVQHDVNHQQYIDKLSYRAFLHGEIQEDRVGEPPRKSYKPFRSFQEFTQMLKSTYDANQFQDATVRSLIEHRILTTTGATRYQILAYLQKCTLMYELVMTHAAEAQAHYRLDHPDGASYESLPFFNTPSRIPVAKHRAQVIEALGNPDLSVSKRDRLQWALDATA